jgi:hypothetical protein
MNDDDFILEKLLVGFSHVWILKCFCKEADETNDFEHWEQL